jgi:hypothetical protein
MVLVLSPRPKFLIGTEVRMQVLQLHSINQLGSLAIIYQFRCTGIYESDEKVIQYCGNSVIDGQSRKNGGTGREKFFYAGCAS